MLRASPGPLWRRGKPAGGLRRAPPATPLWVGAHLLFSPSPLRVWSHVSHLFAAGTFGKAPWRPPHDLTAFGPPLTPNGATLRENPYTAPDADPEGDDGAGDGVYERPFDSGRSEPRPQRRTST